MRIKLFRTEAGIERCRQWHRWFAWRPVVIRGYVVWLERVERRLVLKEVHYVPGPANYVDAWEYKLPLPISIPPPLFNDLAVAVWDEAEAKGTHDALVGLGAEIEPGKEEQPQPKESDAVADAKRRVVAVGDGTFDDYAHRSHVAAEVVDDLVAAVQAADKTVRVKYQNLVYECLRVLDGGRVHDGKGLTVDDLVGKVRELVAVRAADAKGKEVYWGVRGKDKEWEDFVGRRHEGRKGWKHPDGEYLKHRAHLWPDSGSAYAHSGPGDTIVPLVVEMVKEDG